MPSRWNRSRAVPDSATILLRGTLGARSTSPPLGEGLPGRGERTPRTGSNALTTRAATPALLELVTEKIVRG